MSELLTLSKSDPRFRSYIEGTFSKEYRALPIQSLNVNTEAEQVTFKIFPVKEVEQPLLGLHWLQVLKVRNFLLVALPIFLVFVKDWMDDAIPDPITGTLSSLGAIFLMTAVNLRNDYLDHLSGLDRLHPQSELRAIQKGWVTAAQVRKWSFVYLVLGILLGLPSLLLYPKIIFLVGVLALIGIFGMTSYKMGLKYRRWSEWTVFLLLGPLLTCGIQYSLGNLLDLQTVWIGVLTGWLSVFYLHLKNFDQLMVNEQAQFGNTMAWLGFEKGKSWLLTWWILFLLLFHVYQFYFAPLVWQVIFLASSLFVTWPMVKALRKLKSPLGSQMKTLNQLGNQALLFMIGIWILQSLWILWIQ
jgi:1,4-dihydroxy-2-naphthoate octaprenyltransferase